MLTLENCSYMLGKKINSWSEVPEDIYLELLTIPVNMTVEEYKIQQDKKTEEYFKKQEEIKNSELPF